MAFEHKADPLDYHGGGAAGRPEAEVGGSDTSVYPGSQGEGHAHGHKGHKMHTAHKEHSAAHHPKPKELGHHGKKGKY